jgi:hypothetical protein
MISAKSTRNSGVSASANIPFDPRPFLIFLPPIGRARTLGVMRRSLA